MNDWKKQLATIRQTLSYNKGYREPFEFSVADATTGERHSVILRGFSPEDAIMSHFSESEYSVDKKSDAEYIVDFYGSRFQYLLT